MPKVLFLNTYYSMGGAAVSSKRIFESLQQIPSLEVRMLVQKGSSESYPEQVLNLESNFLTSNKSFFNFASERFYFLLHESSKAVRFAFSPANTGTDISRHPWVREADILHLNWVNFGFLSIRGIQKLFALGKPIVWTMHDMWAFTGGCHYAQHCRHFEESCGHCFYLRNPASSDLSYRVLGKKKELLSKPRRIHFVGSSQWLVSELERSSFFKGLSNAQASHIMTPIDMQVYQPAQRDKLIQQLALNQDKFKILFGAMKLSDERKGFKYLKEALQIIEEKYPMMAKSCELVLFGKASEGIEDMFGIAMRYLGILKGDQALVDVYNAVEVFVIPSLDDNLPNTIIESMACGTPVVAFKSGGIPEMIDQMKNGYLADFKSSTDLAEGLFRVWSAWHTEKQSGLQDYQKMREAALQKAKISYAPNHINNQYQSLYQEILAP